MTSAPWRGWRGRAALAAALLATACGPKAPAPPPAHPMELHLTPACGLAPAAGLSWVVEAKPRAIASIDDLIPAVALLLPEARMSAFAAHYGVDPRSVEDLCVASYPGSLLTIARAPIDPARVERAFAERATTVEARTIDVAAPPVVRLDGRVEGEPARLVLFGSAAVALARGKEGPLRAAELFAQGKLHRAAPALRGAALARASEVLGDAPVRAFAPGPFEGEAARGLGGLLRASTAIGASARFAGPPSNIEVTLVLTGAWGDHAGAAAERLSAAVHVLSESGLGRLLGLARPVVPPRTRATPDALVLETTLDGGRLARGLRDAVMADVTEIMR